MRKTILTAAVLAGLAGLGFAGSASATPAGLERVPAAALVQPAQYYYGHPHRGFYHHRWVRYHHWHHWHRDYGRFR